MLRPRRPGPRYPSMPDPLKEAGAASSKSPRRHGYGYGGGGGGGGGSTLMKPRIFASAQSLPVNIGGGGGGFGRSGSGSGPIVASSKPLLPTRRRTAPAFWASSSSSAAAAAASSSSGGANRRASTMSRTPAEDEKVRFRHVYQERWRVRRRLGKGTFAVIYEAEDVHDPSHVVALKVMRKNRLSGKVKAKVQREIEFLKQLNHPHIIRIFDSFTATPDPSTGEELVLVLESMQGGTLLSYVDGQPLKRLPETSASVFMDQIISAVDYCHGMRCAHRDLNLQNIVLDEAQLTVKLIDFGLSNTLQDAVKFDSFCGSLEYTCPEVLQRNAYDGRKADVWSLGVILYSMVTDSFPFLGATTLDTQQCILEADVRYPAYVSSDCRDLIGRLLNPDPDRRPTTKEIRHHPWFVSCQQVLERRVQRGSFSAGLAMLGDQSGPRTTEAAAFAALSGDGGSGDLGGVGEGSGDLLRVMPGGPSSSASGGDLRRAAAEGARAAAAAVAASPATATAAAAATGDGDSVAGVSSAGSSAASSPRVGAHEAGPAWPYSKGIAMSFGNDGTAGTAAVAAAAAARDGGIGAGGGKAALLRMMGRADPASSSDDEGGYCGGSGSGSCGGSYSGGSYGGRTESLSAEEAALVDSLEEQMVFALDDEPANPACGRSMAYSGAVMATSAPAAAAAPADKAADAGSDESESGDEGLVFSTAAAAKANVWSEQQPKERTTVSAALAAAAANAATSGAAVVAATKATGPPAALHDMRPSKRMPKISAQGINFVSLAPSHAPPGGPVPSDAVAAAAAAVTAVAAVAAAEAGTPLAGPAAPPS